MNKKIGVLDSGIGGTTVLDKMVELLPNEEYVYYKDTKNNPYGEKSEEGLYKIVKGIVTFLIDKKNCKMIVLACNTATTKCMKKLRKEFPDMLFVGTVPAVKVACDNHYKHTLVLATPATIDSERMAELVKDNKKDDQEMILYPCPGLADAIEKGKKDTLTQILKELKQKMLIFHGTDDDTALIGDTEKFTNLNNKVAKLIKVPKENHRMKIENLKKIMGYVIKCIKEKEIKKEILEER